MVHQSIPSVRRALGAWPVPAPDAGWGGRLRHHGPGPAPCGGQGWQGGLARTSGERVPEPLGVSALSFPTIAPVDGARAGSLPTLYAGPTTGTSTCFTVDSGLGRPLTWPKAHRYFLRNTPTTRTRRRGRVTPALSLTASRSPSPSRCSLRLFFWLICSPFLAVAEPAGPATDLAELTHQLPRPPRCASQLPETRCDCWERSRARPCPSSSAPAPPPTRPSRARIWTARPVLRYLLILDDSSTSCPRARRPTRSGRNRWSGSRSRSNSRAGGGGRPRRACGPRAGLRRRRDAGPALFLKGAAHQARRRVVSQPKARLTVRSGERRATAFVGWKARRLRRRRRGRLLLRAGTAVGRKGRRRALVFHIRPAGSRR